LAGRSVFAAGGNHDDKKHHERETQVHPQSCAPIPSPDAQWKTLTIAAQQKIEKTYLPAQCDKIEISLNRSVLIWLANLLIVNFSEAPRQ
jgi:hypothetical protein